MKFLDEATEKLFAGYILVFVFPFVQHDHVSGAEVGQEVIFVLGQVSMDAHDGTVFVREGTQVQTCKNVAVLPFGLRVAPPCAGKTWAGFGLLVADFGQKLLALHEREKVMKVGTLCIFHAVERYDNAADARTQILHIEAVRAPEHIDVCFRQFFNKCL